MNDELAHAIRPVAATEVKILCRFRACSAKPSERLNPADASKAPK